MSFIADKQTLEDLNLLGKYKPHSIFSMFNKVKTSGGERLLEEMFRHPLTDPQAINKRSDIFNCFQNKNLIFPFEHEAFSVVENYLGMASTGNLPIATAEILLKKVSGSLLRDDQFKVIYTGLMASVAALKSFNTFLVQLEREQEEPYREELKILTRIFSDDRLKWIQHQQYSAGLTVLQVAKYDYLLRHTLQNEMEKLLEGIYHLDVYIAVAEVGRSGGFFYAKALSKEQSTFSTETLRHPALAKGVANPLSFNQGSNLLFLTGANMAGKSTLMKAFGISVYLAHMGFPVAAEQMIFSVKDGLYSSINVPDNLNLGLSHFYAEVLRVKKVAQEVASGKDLVVLFDELFKGTNVKDACDGTLTVTQAFAKYRNCFFIISTHIIEVGDVLREKANHIQLAYLPTVMEGNVPKYTYQLKKGVTSDRQGMMIIENEGILEIISGS